MPSQQIGAGTNVEWEQLIPVTLIAALALQSYNDKQAQVGGKRRKSKKSNKKRSSKKRSYKKRKSSRKSKKARKSKH
jgi:hypothetical protein